MCLTVHPMVNFILAKTAQHKFSKRKQRFWMHEIKLRRGEVGECFHLFPDLMQDEQKFLKILQ